MITPIIPPFPVVKIEFKGVSASYNPIIVDNETILALIDIAPIIPPRASVAPNCLAEFIPV